MLLCVSSLPIVVGVCSHEEQTEVRSSSHVVPCTSYCWANQCHRDSPASRDEVVIVTRGYQWVPLVIFNQSVPLKIAFQSIHRNVRHFPVKKVKQCQGPRVDGLSVQAAQVPQKLLAKTEHFLGGPCATAQCIASWRRMPRVCGRM